MWVDTEGNPWRFSRHTGLWEKQEGANWVITALPSGGLIRQDVPQNVTVVETMGPQGLPGDPGIDGRGFLWRGAYNFTNLYSPDDVITYNGSMFVCLNETIQNPDEAPNDWELAVEKGEKATTAWNELTGAPGFIAAGDTPQDARAIIGAQSELWRPESADITDSTEVGRSLITSSTVGDAWITLGTIPSNNLPEYVADPTAIGQALMNAETEAAARQTIGAEAAATKGEPDGYAPLDQSGLIDPQFLPATTIGKSLLSAATEAAARQTIGAESAATKGAPGGYAPLDQSGLIDPQYLPSATDDVLEYEDITSFPGVGEIGKLYIDQDTGDLYRWNAAGSSYVRVSERVSVTGITDSTALGRTLLTTGTAGEARTAINADQILGFADVASFPVTGESGKIYVDLSTDDLYRWDGAAYRRVSQRVLSTGVTDSTSLGRTLITAADSSAARTAIGAESAANKGQPNGYVPLNGVSKIESTYLPAYVSDVFEYADFSSFPVTGEASKIYVALDTGFTYRWSGTVYVRISDSVSAAGITDSTSVGRSLITAADADAARAVIGAEEAALKGQPDGYAPLNSQGLIEAQFIPDADDVLEFNELAAFPGTGSTGKLYIAQDTGYLYRWTGAAYTRVGRVSAAGITDSTTVGRAVLTAADAAEARAALGAEGSASKGQPNGYASLDGGGKVPVSQLPASIMQYLGVWDATTNTPTLVDGTGDPGDVYRVSVAGDIDLGGGVLSFSVGDYVIYNGSVWEKSDTTDAVASVNGYTGVVTIDKEDLGLENVDNTSDATKWSSSVTVSNKTLDNTNVAVFRATNFTIQDASDATRQARFSVEGVASGETRVFALPDANATLVGLNTAQVLSGKTISGETNTLENIALSSVTNLESLLGGKESSANKGQANGYVPLNGSTKIDTTYLPSYVDDVLEYATQASFPVTGESGKIYIAVDTNTTWRWTGSTYIQVGGDPNLSPGNYATTIGDGSTTVFTITHNLATVDVLIGVWEAATGVEVNCDKARSTLNTVTLTFAQPPALNAYRVAVLNGGVVADSAPEPTWSISTLTGSGTLSAAQAHKYIVLLGAGAAATLPTAVGNSSLYTLKNIDNADKSVATTSSQTVEGGTLTLSPGASVELVSDGANWRII